MQSCAELSEAGKKLKVTSNVADVRGCQQVGAVQASSTMGGDAGLTMVGNSNSSVKLRNLAARYGDTLLITKDEEGLLGSDREGVVFRCAGRVLGAN